MTQPAGDTPDPQRDADPRPEAESAGARAEDASREPRHLVDLTPARRAKAILATVPLVVASTIALSVGMAGPAAAAQLRRVDRVKPNDSAQRAARDAIRPRVAESAPRSYVVVAGDTVSGIAGRYGLSTAGVLALNGLSWKSLIFPGQTLVLTEGRPPSASSSKTAAAPITRHTVVEGDTVSGIAESYGLSTQTVLSANGLDAASVIYPGETIAIPDAAPAVPSPAPPSAVSPAPAQAPVPVAAPSPVSGTMTSLSAEMRTNAQTIIVVGRAEGVDDYGIVIALAAAMQESGLRNRPVGDRDSLGLFQQRPSTGWGTPEQIMDPTFAARSFFGGDNNPHPGLTKGLLDIPGWSSMTVSQAAQAVQLSAHPDAYAKWEASARAWLAELG
ncbi:MAG: LysM peptidoglycan-binding domain-containing protein [Microbacteriaceae bacterium]|nr:MAG: LysM peptidoglycan-binding domain-containing protein [Microbacteriaceae bacterium]